MDAKDKALSYAPVIGLVGILGLILYLKVRDLKEKGIVNEVGEIILGKPDETEIGELELFDVKPEDLARADHVPLGVWAQFITPAVGAIVNRTAYFGSEIEMRIQLQNLGSGTKRLDLWLTAIETDIRPDYPQRVFLKTVILPPGKGANIDGYYAMKTRAIVTGRLDIAMDLEANGVNLAWTTFEVS